MTRQLAHVVSRVAPLLFISFIAAPFLWTIWASLIPEAQLFARDGSTQSAPWSFDLSAYRALFAEQRFLVPLRTSLVVALATTICCVVLAVPASYALARMPMRGVQAILGAVLAASVLPQISVVAPLFLLLRALHLVDTIPGLVIPYTTFALPLALWLLTGMMRALPKELEEAALVEGASRLRIITQVVLPMAAPAIATTSILVFIYCWNEFLFALSFTVSPEMHTLPVAIAMLRGQHQVPWSQVLAAAILTTLPVALIVLAFQRRIVSGLTAGALKG